MNARMPRTSGLPFRILANGDAAMVVEFGDRIDLAVNGRVLALADRIAEAPIAGVVETVPTFRSLMIAFDPARVAFSALADRVSRLLDQASARPHPGRLWRLPVCYDPEVAPDLPEAAERAGLTPEAFVSRHASITHHVYMLGFLPGQPYLGDLPPELALPRRETPRTKVAAGSVGVAARMTCLFPKETPCGLNIIGRTPAVLWDPGRATASLLVPGDDIVFAPVDLDDFGRLAREAASGALVLAPTGAAAAPMDEAA
jgi:KipI family sensor histidine kinase inhibitor